ncbi:MAG TPA: RidA family protein [Cyclobacteriaceae bacterium]|nr:RidA family protein [Cyclobacteriaceae bacterium]
MMKQLAILISLTCLYGSVEGQIIKEYINPGPGYTHVVTISDTNTKTIYVSGQVGEGKDLATQLRSAFGNLKKQLADAGAQFSDVVKMTTYIVRYKESDLETFRKIRGEILGDKEMPANTLVGVYSLYKDEYLVELEAVAVIENK